MNVACPFFVLGSSERISGTNGFRSGRRLDFTSKTTTAIWKRDKCCWDGSRLSTVRKTSKPSLAARAKSFPFLMEAQPILGTLVTLCPVSSRPSRQSRHSSRRIFISDGCEHSFLGFFQKRDDLRARNGGETFQKIVDGVSRFDVIHQRLHGNPCSGKARSSAHNFWI